MNEAFLLSAHASARTDGIAEELLPAWARSMSGFVGAWIYRDPEDTPPSLINVGEQLKATGRMDVHRVEEDVYKSYRYVLAEFDDGRVFSKGPFKNLDYGHHLSEPPPWTRDPNGDGA